MAQYILPDLDYDYGALEPHISGEIMELHHSKHHKAYVTKANETLEKLEQARDGRDFERLAGLEKSLAFNLSGHVLHSIFWKNLVPKGGGAQRAAVASAVRGMSMFRPRASS
jgi:Fe-Mn family superoxide dismutase